MLVVQRRHEEEADREHRNDRPDQTSPGHDGGGPRIERPACQGKETKPRQAPDGIHDDVGRVEAAGGQQVLGRLQEQARHDEHARPLPRLPCRRQQAEVDAERDEEDDVRDEFEGCAGTGLARGQERDQLDRAWQQGSRPDIRDIEFPDDRPRQQHEVDREQHDQQALFGLPQDGLGSAAMITTNTTTVGGPGGSIPSSITKAYRLILLGAGTPPLPNRSPRVGPALTSAECTFSLLNMRSALDQDLTARATIRNAALQLFADRGPDAVTVREIAAGAGVSAALILHHFGSKDGLRAAVDEFAAQAFDSIFEAMPTDELAELLTGEAPRGSLAEAFARGFPTGSPLPAYLGRLLLTNDPAGEALFAHWYAQTRRVLDEMVEMGAARPSEDPDVGRRLWSTTSHSSSAGQDRRRDRDRPADSRGCRAVGPRGHDRLCGWRVPCAAEGEHTVSAAQAVIVARGLTKTFGSVRALDGLDFEWPPARSMAFSAPTERASRRRSGSCSA